MSPAEARHGPKTESVPLVTKIIYGTGDWGLATFTTLRNIRYAIFLTDVVGLDLYLASFAALIGVLWDAINDPIIGIVSDRVRTRWGSRRPFLVLFSIPFGLAFILLWWAPPWDNQLILATHITLAFMAADTLQTLVAIPFYALTPAMTESYDERTSLSAYRMFFNLVASLVAAAAAPEVLSVFSDPRHGYLMMGALFGFLGMLPFIPIYFATFEHHTPKDIPTTPIRESIRATWSNIPFRIATAVNVLNWVTLDLVALMLPFFLIYWVEQGNQHSTIMVPLIGTIAFESVLFLVLFSTAILALPLWAYLATRAGKRNAYIIGMTFWAVVQLLIITIQPGQRTYILILTFLAGISVSTGHILPDALFPDVLEWDELRTGQRRDGLYYGLKAFIRKGAGALAIFLALRALGAFGYQQPPLGAEIFQQPPQALLAIRMLTGPVGALFLLSAIITAFFYPISRKRHERVRSLLARRRLTRQPAPHSTES